MELISIIMPVYNAEKLISRSIESVLYQTYKNYELIIVDDGSTDNSYNICKKYSNKDNRIKVFTKSNGGPASARNYALNIVNGTYIMFLDADDILDYDCLLKLINSANSGDVEFVCSGHYRNYINNEKKVIMESVSYVGEIVNFLDQIDKLLEKDIIQAPWAKLFKNEVIKKMNIRFPENMIFGEDTWFVYEYLLHIDKVKVIEEPLYYHSIYDGSLSQRLVQNIIDINITLYKKLADLMKNKNVTEWEIKISKPFINSIIYGISSIFRVEYRLEKSKKIGQIKSIIEDNFGKFIVINFPIKGIQYKVVLYGIRSKNEKIIFVFFDLKEKIRYIRDKIRRMIKI